MKRLAGLSALALIISSTSACSWLGITGKDGYFRDRTDDYLEERQTAPMQLPTGVQSKPLDPLLLIPVPLPPLAGCLPDRPSHRPATTAKTGSAAESLVLLQYGDFWMSFVIL